jgi:hypothetical protein
MTKSQWMRDSAVMISSTMPSAKYSCSGSPLILAKGSTAIDGLSGRGSEEPTTGVAIGEVLASDAVCLDRLSNIFHLLLAEISEAHRQLRPDMVSNSTRDANPTRLSKSLQAGGDINGVAEEIVALNDDIADMYPDAEPHLLTGRSIRILLCYGVLHRDSTLHGVHSTSEVSDETIASRVEDPTAMRGDQAIYDDPVRGEGAERVDLILPHQSAVALDIGCEEIAASFLSTE